MQPLILTTPTTTSTRVVRTFTAPQAQVWRAYTEPDLVQRWMTGPPTHSLIECRIDLRIGGKARYVWKSPDFEMGMDAEFLDIQTPERIVHTEDFEGWPEGKSRVTTDFAQIGAQTTVTLDIDYLTQEARDAALQPGFAEGYEASFVQLDALLAAGLSG